MLGGLYPFGNHLHAQTVAQRDHGAGNHRIIGVGEQVAHERLVNLELRQRQLLQVRQG